MISLPTPLSIKQVNLWAAGGGETLTKDCSSAALLISSFGFVKDDDMGRGSPNDWCSQSFVQVNGSLQEHRDSPAWKCVWDSSFGVDLAAVLACFFLPVANFTV